MVCFHICISTMPICPLIGFVDQSILFAVFIFRFFLLFECIFYIDVCWRWHIVIFLSDDCFAVLWYFRDLFMFVWKGSTWNYASITREHYGNRTPDFINRVASVSRKSGSPLHCGFVYTITDWCHFLLCGSTIITWFKREQMHSAKSVLEVDGAPLWKRPLISLLDSICGH